MTKTTVFISYASEDRLRATRLYTDLKEAGLDPWIDHISLQAGQQWGPLIWEEIRNRRFFIALFSDNYASKLSPRRSSGRGHELTYVERELNEALKVLKAQYSDSKEQYLIPVRVDNTWTDHEGLQELHWIDLVPEWNEGRDRLLEEMGISRERALTVRRQQERGLRVATFNLGNLDWLPAVVPPFEDRVAAIRPQLEALDADVLCLQEVNSQEGQDQSRHLEALDELLHGTRYADYFRCATLTSRGELYTFRNLVTLSSFKIERVNQFRHDLFEPFHYRIKTSFPGKDQKRIQWERPILYACLRLESGAELHVINAHLKSRLPTSIEGQIRSSDMSRQEWKTAASWAEGHMMSSLKRVGQAMEVRFLVEQIFDLSSENDEPNIVVCGSLNTDMGEPAMEILRAEPREVRFTSGRKRSLIPTESGISESGRYTLFYETEGKMIDHILVSQSLLEHYRYSEIHNTHLQTWLPIDVPSPYSDHAPVVAEFRPI